MREGSRWFVLWALAALLASCGGGESQGNGSQAIAEAARAGAICESGPSPRQVAPLSTSTVTARRPTLRWIAPPGAAVSLVQVCADAACADVETTLATLGASARPLRPLGEGVHFWRVFTVRGAHHRCAFSVSRTWEFFVRHRGAPTDTSWGTVADFNRDGIPDLAVGAPDAGPGGDEPEGRVYVYHGTLAGLPAAPDVVLTTPGTGVRFVGDAVASAGDVNGDGYGDLVVGNRLAADDDGVAWVFHGGAAGLSSVPSVTIPGPESGFFGESVSGVGDLDGDGYGDVAIGAPSYDNARGAVQLHRGSAAGVAAAPDLTLTPPAGGEGAFGNALGAGDFDGDGLGDLAVGAVQAPLAGAQTGRAFVYLGVSGALPAAPSTTLSSPYGPDLRFGRAVTGAGDLDGDGYADLAVGASLAAGDTGHVRVYLGGAAGIAAASSATLVGPDGPDGLFGRRVAAAGDVNGDGYDDLAVASVTAGGRVHVYHGTAAGVGGAASVTLDAPLGAGSGFGEAVTGLGDLDADGFADLAVGAPSEGFFSGRVYRYDGSAAGLVTPPAGTLAPPDDGRFGAALAGRL